MTTTKQPPDDGAGARGPEPTPFGAGKLTYRCAAHQRYFPDEPDVLPYTEFNVDPITLKRVHDSACRRCVTARRRGQDVQKRRERELPPLERIRAYREQLQAEQRSLAFRSGGQSDRAEQIAFILEHLAQEERRWQARGAARDSAAE